MCGIAGILKRSGDASVDEGTLRGMADAIAHRGPDADGFWNAPGIGLAHRRLSIIDLEAGRQPMSDADGNLHIVFNGEIYNFQELRRDLISRGHPIRTHSDTEVLLYLYKDHGQNMVDFLRGMFAFAIWDAPRQQLLLARDRIGQKPLYYFRDSEKLVFASELKSIVQHPDVDPSIDPRAVDAYLTFGFIPGELSIYRSIRKLPPAHRLLLRRDAWEQALPERYWRLEAEVDESRTGAEWIEAIREKLSETVRCHRIADVPVGAFLSGGVDSSVMVAEMSRQSDTPLKTFSIGFDDETTSELPYARQVAQRYGTDHVERIVTPDVEDDFEKLIYHYDEPFADSSALPTMVVARVAAEHVKVAISGDGGDEAFGGYSRYLHDLREASIRRKLPNWFRGGLLAPAASAWPKASWLPRPLRLKSALTNLSRDAAAAYANTLSISDTRQRHALGLNGQGGASADRYVQQCYRGDVDDLSAMSRCDIDLILPDDFLVKVDRASMAVGLEVRPPLVDHEFLELAASIPARFKVRGGMGKWIFKRAYDSELPESILHRKKQGFELPVDRWLKGPLRDRMEAVCDTGSPLSTLLEPTAVESLYDSHRRGTGRHGNLLWALLVFDGWMREASCELRVESRD
jgi:asparagine synthase (glutamine-hydrolysing)